LKVDAEDEEGPDGLVTVGGAAKLLGVHPNTVRSWGSSGRLPETRSGPRLDRRYRAQDVLELKRRLAEQQSAVEAASGTRRAAGTAGASRWQGADLLATQMAGVDFSGALAAAHLGAQVAESLTQFQRRFAADISRLFDPSPLASVATAMAELTARPALLAHQMDAIVANQAKISASLNLMAMTIPAQLSADLLLAALPSKRVLGQMLGLSSSLGSGSVLSEQLALTSSQFRNFTSHIADALYLPDAAQGESVIAVDELALGGQILERAVGGLGAFRPSEGEAEAFQLTALTPTAYTALALEVDEQRPELLQLSRHQILERLRQSVPVQISQTATRVASLRYRCCRSALLLSGKPTFSATTETEFAAVNLPQWVARDEEDFARFIDMLFIFIYESSANHTRITEVDEAIVDNHQILTDITRLRHFFRHDLDHGPSAKGAAKFRRIGDIYLSLTGVRVPNQPSLWAQAQLRILRQLAEALEDLVTALERRRT
jgi:hypothetical protein